MGCVDVRMTMEFSDHVHHIELTPSSPIRDKINLITADNTIELRDSWAKFLLLSG